MRYVYIITHEIDYEGNMFVDITSNKKQAIRIAELHPGGDDTLVTKYTVLSANSDEIHREPEVVAHWSNRRSKFKRIL